MIIKIIEPIGQSEDAIRARLGDLLHEGGHNLFVCDTRGMADGDLIKLIGDADILLLSNRPLSGNVINASPNLKLICVAFTGIDHVDQEACKTRGIIIHNAAGYAVHAVSELAIGLMVALLRRIIPADTKTRAGGTNDGLVGHELFGKTLGVVGCGHIGLQVARLGKAFGCHVLGFDPHAIKVSDVDMKQVELDQLLSQSDIVTLHLPLIPETRGFIGRDQLTKMKRSAILINTARGPIVDRDALIEALSGNRLAGAGLDVFDLEPPLPDNHPILTVPNTVLTPHIGFETAEAMAAKASIALGHLEDFLHNTAESTVS
ncbi:MAG: hydroxyacid dehydrogenase [Verrucomicrobia bacterium]|nr:hydroxyacid dehydrogenase [Verrucomicrobiota bacterium]MBV8278213.1 hydroxyacid dehydrogenase [Verrucomicrobiota bacterium]